MRKINLKLKINKEDLKNKINDTPGEIRDKLESLLAGKKLSIQAIDGLAKILEELLKNRNNNSVGGVFSSKSSNVKFIDDETPTNSGDDTNFTIKRLPASGSFKLYRNGSRQKLTEDYTLSGKNLTLITSIQSGEILLCDYRIN